MKLIYCSHCDDVRKLSYTLTTCECGRSFGKYDKDGLNAMYSGEAVPIGFANQSFMDAFLDQPESGQGQRFEAFVIPKKCPTFTQVKKIKTTKSIPYLLGPMGPKCRDALQALIESMDSALPGVINQKGTILVRNHLARRLGTKRFGPDERYMVFELTAEGRRVCRDLGLIPDEGTALDLAGFRKPE